MSSVDDINHLLGIDGAITRKGDELKCWTHDEEGGRSKTYLDANNCTLLAVAFLTISNQLRAAMHAAESNGGDSNG